MAIGFSVEEVRAIAQVVGNVHVGKTNLERTQGFEMWRALQDGRPMEIRRILFNVRYGVDRQQMLFSEH